MDVRKIKFVFYEKYGIKFMHLTNNKSLNNIFYYQLKISFCESDVTHLNILDVFELRMEYLIDKLLLGCNYDEIKSTSLVYKHYSGICGIYRVSYLSPLGIQTLQIITKDNIVYIAPINEFKNENTNHFI